MYAASPSAGRQNGGEGGADGDEDVDMEEVGLDGVAVSEAKHLHRWSIRLMVLSVIGIYYHVSMIPRMTTIICLHRVALLLLPVPPTV